MKSPVLLVIGALFAMSVIGRAGVIADNVQAAAGPDDGDASDTTAPAIAENLSDTKSDTLSAEPPAGYDLPEKTIEEDICSANPLVLEVSAQRKELAQRLEDIDERERWVLIAENRLAEQLAALKQTQAEIADNLALLERAAHEDVSHLSSMYESMKPSRAGLIFNKMDPGFAATFLRQMKSENAGLIMANMDADSAHSVSITIAQQNADFRADK